MNTYNTLQTLNILGKEYKFHNINKLKEFGFKIDELPICIRIILESLLRNQDENKITKTHIEQLASWKPNDNRINEIPFVLARVVLQDFTGVPLLCDLASMRSVAQKLNKDPKIIEPLVPVDLVVDHSIQVDNYAHADSMQKNMEIEFARNHERYEFLKWGMQAFKTFKVVPPGVGIIHQVNLEYFFKGIRLIDDMLFPDTLVGTDSHTTMINAVGVVGWGVGGIEAEAAMLGQPLYFLTPDVVGVGLKGKLKEGITATDLVLKITQMLRHAKVVGKFVEFYGAGVECLSVTDRATIANMAPEYGATMGYFPIDNNVVKYLEYTGKSKEDIKLFEEYFKAQNMFGIPQDNKIKYSEYLTLDLASIEPSLAGPKRPQDLVLLSKIEEVFNDLFIKPIQENGFNKKADELHKRYDIDDHLDIGHGDVVIAAITSCTNTSNPFVLIAAGILAKHAIEHGLSVSQRVKTSLAPGSRVVTEYLHASGLSKYLDQLGFNLVGYGCTTCIGNSGSLKPEINDTIVKNDIIACAVLSGNRNFEARIHPSIKANFLASPPLVVAYAIAGRMNINLNTEPLGVNQSGQHVYLKDIWPSTEQINEYMHLAQNADIFKKLYSNLDDVNRLWSDIKTTNGMVYNWPKSTYIANPPFFDNFSMTHGEINDIKNAKALLVLGDSVTTDHISPAGSFKAISPAGKYLIEHHVNQNDFNSYGSRRGNHEIMIRGTFANVRIKNLMLTPKPDGGQIEGGYTLYNDQQVDIFVASEQYIKNKIPTVIFAGEEYGTGSSRDWAAKGTLLLGVKAVIAKSFERIHRSNLVGMGVLPLQFIGEDSIQSLNITGLETYDILGISQNLHPQQKLTLHIKYANNTAKDVEVICRIDTPIEVEYYKHGGILQYVLRALLNAS